MEEIKIKYLLIINSYTEEETYIYNSKEEIYKDWECKDEKEFIDKFKKLFKVTIIEVKKAWKF